MKILAIPDQHGSDNWFNIIQDNTKKVDKIVQLGDWFDETEISPANQIENFKRACDFSRANPKFCICIGNHDLGYLSNPNVSNHQVNAENDIRKVIEENLDILNIAYCFANTIFSHAGFTKTWMQNNDFHTIEEVNKAFHDKNYKIFDWCGLFNSEGDEVTQGPLWVRPRALISDSYFINQIVGHTLVTEPIEVDLTVDDGSIDDSFIYFIYKNSSSYLIVSEIENNDLHVKMEKAKIINGKTNFIGEQVFNYSNFYKDTTPYKRTPVNGKISQILLNT
jgi:hypothetical protein